MIAPTKKRYRIYWHRLNHVLNMRDVPSDWRNFETHLIVESDIRVVREIPFTTRIV